MKNRGRKSLAINTSFVLILFLSWSAASTLAAPGDLDATFGQDGVYFDTASSQSCFGLYPRASAVQADGKLIVVGKIFDKCNFTALNDPVMSRRLYIRRYRSNGTPDNGPWWTSPFGVDGFGVSDTGAGISLMGDAYSILIQSDGKIVVGGMKWSWVQGSTATVWRFDTAGELDTTFGTNGVTSFSTNLNTANASGLAIQQNKVLVGVSTNNNTNIRLFRLNSNGASDPTFGFFAQIVTGITPVGYRFGMATDPHLGVIYVSGKISNPGNGHVDPVVSRYFSNGNLDTTFGSSGRAFYPVCTPTGANIATDIDAFTNVAVQSGGKVLASGDGQLVGLGGVSITTRYTGTGMIDPTFGAANSSPCQTVASSLGAVMRKQPNDMFLLRYTRYDANGIPDPTFYVNGPIHGNQAATALDPTNGNIVLVNNDGTASGIGCWLHRVLP